MSTPRSVSDRLIFALIGAVFGTVMGAALCYGAVFALALPKVPTHIVTFSGVYFGLVAFVAGELVGDLVAATIGGLLDLLAIASAATRPTFTDEHTFRPLWVGLLFVLWLAVSWGIYLRS